MLLNPFQGSKYLSNRSLIRLQLFSSKLVDSVKLNGVMFHRHKEI